MMTVLLIVLATLVVCAAGEAVRGQCRRMLARPVRLTLPDAVSRDVTA